MDNNKKITIEIGKVNLPVIDNIVNTDNKLLFGEQYKKALSALNLYLEKNNTKTKHNNLHECSNNIFVFVGERGTGKTSCMSSVANLLKSENSSKIKTNYKALSSTKFENIDIIDPSYFDNKHNIIATIVATLYKKYRELVDVKTTKPECDFTSQRNLTEAFANVQHSLHCLLDIEESDDLGNDLDNLIQLSQAVNLKKDIENLVNEYLRFTKCEKNGKLLLCIDDIDLNINQADAMSEQIRKYLISPNIIILMAINIDQLRTIKKLYFSEQYKRLIDEHEIDSTTIDEMVEHYISKLAPQDQRIYMPSADIYFDSELEIIDSNKSTVKKELQGRLIKQAIPELICKKTDYLFYNSSHLNSYIIPRNLRKLSQFISFLYTMPDDDKEYNRKAFKNYLLNTWVKDNLDKKRQDDISIIWDGYKEGILNRIVLDRLKNRYSEFFIDGDKFPDEASKEIKQITNKHNLDYNISIGDVLGIITYLQKDYKLTKDLKYFFIINSIYSIALIDSYNDLIQYTDIFNDSDKKASNCCINNNLLYNPFEDNHLSEYHKIIGGRLFNYRIYSKIPKSKTGNDKCSRTDRIINFAKLIDCIKECNKSWEIYKEGKLNNEEISKFKEKVNIVEFFLLCISREIDTKKQNNDKDFYEPDFRTSDEIYYNGAINTTNRKNIYFDLGAFFYNITNIKACYCRFDEAKELYLYANSEEWNENNDYISLLAKFKYNSLPENIADEKQISKNWLSASCIRNAEIIYDINSYIQSARYRDGGNINILEVFFKKILTYDKDFHNKNKLQTIDYSFLEHICIILKDVSDDKNGIKEDFNKIYNTFEVDKNNKEYLITTHNLTDEDCEFIIDTIIEKYFRKPTYSKSTIRKKLNLISGIHDTDYNYIKDVLNKYPKTLSKEQIKECLKMIIFQEKAQQDNSKKVDGKDAVEQRNDDIDNNEINVKQKNNDLDNENHEINAEQRNNDLDNENHEINAEQRNNNLDNDNHEINTEQRNNDLDNGNHEITIEQRNEDNVNETSNTIEQKQNTTNSNNINQRGLFENID